MDNPDPNAQGNQDPNAQGTQTPDPNAQGGGTITKEPTWRDGLSADIKEHPALATFKTVDDLAKSHLSAQQMIGKEKLPMPSKDATLDSDEYGMIFDRLGRPSDPQGYVLPDLKLPQGAEVPEQMVKDFKAKAHSIGLLPAQVEELYKYDYEKQMALAEQATAAQTEELQTTETALRKKYGKSYDAKLSSINGLITKFGGQEMAQFIAQSGMGRNEKFLNFMVAIAANFGEDGELTGEPIRSHILSPDEATKKIKQIKGDTKHPWHLRDHPEHEDAMKEMQYLFEMAYPEKQ
jgi:hypothetical protein